jgi:dihydrofolate synthase / folylpolyglutamate synthase
MHSYEEAVAYLYGLGNEVAAMKLGLESITRLLERLGDPQRSFAAAIVAGTNGKGSVSCMLESIARTAGLTTGLYTSPHLVAIEERVRVAGRQLPRDRFAELAARVRDAAEALVDEGALPAPPTYFEQMTAIAFLEFAARRVDLAVLEVGMGGRLDATNVVAPLVAVVTSVALDHQQYLGETLAEIAAEKAAVIKPGAAAVIAHQPIEALEPLMARCLACDVLPVFAGEPEIHHSENGRFTFSYETEHDRYERLSLGLRGRHQVENAMVAVHAAEALRRSGLGIPRTAIAEGLATAEWPGRLEMLLGAPPVLLDGAHNPAGAAALRAYLDEFCHCPLTLVFGAMEDKQIAEMAAELFPAARAVVLTRPNTPRAADPARLATTLPPARGGGRPVVTRTVDEALAWAFHVTPRDGLVCVAGSLYLVGEARSRLASRDPFAPAGRRP